MLEPAQTPGSGRTQETAVPCHAMNGRGWLLRILHAECWGFRARWAPHKAAAPKERHKGAPQQHRLPGRSTSQHTARHACAHSGRPHPAFAAAHNAWIGLGVRGRFPSASSGGATQATHTQPLMHSVQHTKLAMFLHAPGHTTAQMGHRQQTTQQPGTQRGGMPCHAAVMGFLGGRAQRRSPKNKRSQEARQDRAAGLRGCGWACTSHTPQ